jgi:acyl-CoA thioester hydrolase
MSGRHVFQPLGEITHRGIVNTPECDENGHMNVQFYWAKFARADTQFRLIAGFSEQHCPRRSRHVRYHAELHGAFGLHVVSRLAGLPDGSIAILHQMIDSDRGVLSATALDQLDVPLDFAASLTAAGPLEPAPASALPRSLTQPLPAATKSQADWLAEGAVFTCRTVVEPELTGPDRATGADAVLTDRGFVALSVEAAPASWSYGGFPQDVLKARGLGRVALEKRLAIFARPRIGDCVEILTRIVAVERVTFSVRHHYYDSRSSTFLGVCDVTLLPMDLSLRKGVALPEDVRTRMQALAER